MISRSSKKPLLPSDMNLNTSTGEENLNGQIKYAELLSTENSNGTGSLVLSQPNLIVNRLYDLQESIKDADDDKSNDITAVDLLSFSRQIAMGMEYLSSNRVVHRDLAARNVLVCSDKTVKIADFGLSRDIYQENIYKKSSSGKLPIKWMALESLTHQVYTTQSDVWSFGILLWEIVTLGGNPYPSVPTGRLQKLLQSGYRLECPPNCSQELYNLMLSCWQMRPKDRPGFTDIRLQLDKLLDGMCSQVYLSLDVIDYKECNKAIIVATDKISKGSESNQNDLTDSERYVRPITIGRKPAILPAQPNHYISQPSSGNYPNPTPTILTADIKVLSASLRHPSFNNKHTMNFSDSSFNVPTINMSDKFFIKPTLNINEDFIKPSLNVNDKSFINPTMNLNDKSLNKPIKNMSDRSSIKPNNHTFNIIDSSFNMTDPDKSNGHLQNAINTISRNTNLNYRSKQHLKSSPVTQFAGH